MNQKRIRDYGITVGRLETGRRNKITDVPGVRVGHVTIKNQENHTGVTVILPGQDNAFVYGLAHLNARSPVGRTV